MMILITGGAGFIGKNLAIALDRLDHDVIVLDDMSAGSITGLPTNVSVIQSDVSMIAEEMSEWNHRVDAIVHCACLQMPASVGDPPLDEHTHVLGTISVLEAARANRTKVVYVSSCSIYGKQYVFPIPEHAPLNPFTIYAAGKLGGEAYARAYHEHGWVPVTILRLSNVYGPWQVPSHHAGVVGRFMQSSITGDVQTIHGNGLATRDFTYVDDVVDAIIRSIGCSSMGPYNVGTGVETRIKDLAARMGIKARFEPLRSVDRVDRRSLSSSRIRNDLGWEPNVDLDVGLELTRKWWDRVMVAK